MLLLIVISGLLFTLNGNCQQNQNIPNQDSSHFPSGQTVGNVNPGQRSDMSQGQPQNGNETAGFIRKDTRNSEVITIGRNDGHRTTFTTYENKGFYAHTGVDKSPPSWNHVSTPRTSIGGVPVPTNNEFTNRDIYPVASNIPQKAAYPSIGGNPVQFKQNNIYSPHEPWTSNRNQGHQTNAAGESFGDHMDNPNQLTSRNPGHQMTGGAHSIGGRPVYLTNNMYKPYQPWSNNLTPNTSSYYAAAPSIGGREVPLHPNFQLNQFENEKLVSNMGIGLRIGVLPDDLEDNLEAGETGRFSWQVSVFSKEVSPYVRVCGGSIVTSTAVISAARGFWGVGALPANQFVVGAETVDNPNTISDEYSSYLQKIDVRAIKIPPRFRGASSNYQEDIALLLMQQPFFFHQRLRPVCVSFDPALDERQLADGSQGTILGTRFADTNPSPILLNLRVPVVSIEQCLRETAEQFLRLITSDKICAGVNTTPPNATICAQDIGSGLAFTFGPKNAALPVPFLRAVASSPLFPYHCSAYSINTYTHVQSHRAFVLQHVPDVERECSKHYPHVRTLLNDGHVGQRDDDEEADSDEEQFVCNCYC